MKTTLRLASVSAFAAAFAVPASGGILQADEVRADRVLAATVSVSPRAESDAFVDHPFLEDGGTVAVDASTNAYDGVVSGCVWTNAAPFRGGSMLFRNRDDGITLSGVPGFPAWNRYSLSLWFLHDGGGYTGSQYGHKMLDKTSFYHDWHLSLDRVGNGSIRLVMYENGVSRSFGDGTHDYRDGTWHHVAVVRDGTNAWFWVDGSLKRSITNMFSVATSSPLCIGNSQSTDAFQRVGWSGMLDEVRVFDRALSEGEIRNLHAFGALSRPCVSIETNAIVSGSLSVEGDASVFGGTIRLRPLGDLATGTFSGD
ncbi:MAG: LamG domain-containing protein [Kiritimatiellae bacterium]|nr:LamG domain-containing protein [Kiritimatiellia bacterium]MBQ6246215.1 LamG domain-containing protein [Kiritimatiellia bacterium]